MSLEFELSDIVKRTVSEFDRPDLFREPLVRFCRADDPQFDELKHLIGPWHNTPTELLPEAKTVISYFVPFTKEVVFRPKTTERAAALWAEAYQEINAGFDVVNQRLKDHLESHGHKVVTIQSTHTYDPKDMKASWSHRSVAVIAGLATLGANRLAMTEKGSGGRFCSIITSADIEPFGESNAPKCLYLEKGSCGLCFKSCPTGALTPDSLDKFACQDWLNANQDELRNSTDLVDADVCGKCISACPFAYID